MLELLLAAALQDQMQSGSDEPAPLVVDILAPSVSGPVDEEAVRRCEEEADVARIQGEIVVCRELSEDGAPGFDKEDFERRYGEATQGPKTPDVDGTGVQYRTLGSTFVVTVTTKVGKAPEPPLFIDVEALPEAAPGSDADRLANGLPARSEE